MYAKGSVHLESKSMATVTLKNVMKIYPYSGDEERKARRAREKEAVAKQLTDNLDRAYQDLHDQEDFMRRIGVWQRFCNFIKEKFRERQEAERNERTR